jgi:exo-beta-1,3-glucanase (GH17 family)
MAFFGVCYGPYRKVGWAPPNVGPTADSVDADMKAIAGAGYKNVRTYGVTGGNQWNVDKATKYGLRLGLGIEVNKGDSLTTVTTRIRQGLAQAAQAAVTYKREIMLDLVIGNEVDLQKIDPPLISNAMKTARAERTGYRNVAAGVTSCFTATALQYPDSTWTSVVRDCEIAVYLTVYPWYAFKAGSSADPANIDSNMQWSWDNGMKQAAALGKKIVIAEIGWPSDGAPQWKTSIPNEKINYGTTVRWVSGPNNVGQVFDTYWFQMFDEPWKVRDGAWESHFGLYTAGDNPQRKF